MRREPVREVDNRVWDLVHNLVHPAAIYVLLQLFILDRLSRTPLLHPFGPLHPVSLAIYCAQFLGAWTVFYTTLLRDMGYGSVFGTLLLLWALLGAILCPWILANAENAAEGRTAAFLGAQLLPAVISWPWQWQTWRKRKSEYERKAAEPGDLRPSALLPLLAFQDLDPSGKGPSGGNEVFFDLTIWILTVVPFLIVIGLAAAKRKRKPELPQVTDTTFEQLVRDAECPVVVHAYQSWSIGDKVIEAQVEKLPAASAGLLKAYWLDIDKNPDVVSLYPTLGEKCVALFLGKSLVWQSEGVHDHLTMWREIEAVLAKKAAQRAR